MSATHSQEDVSGRLGELRTSIDDVDARLVAVLAERFALVEDVARLKARNGMPVLAPDRLRTVLERARANAIRNGLDPAVAHRLYDAIHAEACAVEEAILAEHPDGG